MYGPLYGGQKRDLTLQICVGESQCIWPLQKVVHTFGTFIASALFSKIATLCIRAVKKNYSIDIFIHKK